MDNGRVSKLTSRVAALFSVLLALAIPFGYFAIAYQYTAGALASEAEINAELVSGLISRNPLLWRFEEVRLEEILARRPHSGNQEKRRVLDLKGEVVAECGGRLAWPVITRSHELMDAGKIAGSMEISQSLFPLAGNTLLALVAGLVLAAIAYRVLPYREIIATQERLEDSNAFLKTVMESSTNAIVVLDPQGCVAMANRRALELSGYSWPELSGRSLSELLDQGSGELLSDALKEISQERSKSVRFETAVQGRRSDLLEVSCGIAPFSRNGKPAGFVLCAEDITSRKLWENQLKAAAAELEQSNTELKSFAYIISHDLRAPLVNIRGFSAELTSALGELSTLIRGAEAHLGEKARSRAALLLDEEVPEALDFINGSVLRMDRLINAVLKLSRLGHRELRQEPVQLDELVSGILKSMSHQIEERQATVEIGALPELVGDRIALEQVLGNLLDNAVKYLDPARPGRLEVFGEMGPAETVIHVRDNGRGIAADDQEKVFEIFRRSGKQDVQGEGMGLAYVKTLVRGMRGQIWCRSELGCGSTFSFSIPQGAGAARL